MLFRSKRLKDLVDRLQSKRKRKRSLMCLLYLHLHKVPLLRPHQHLSRKSFLPPLTLHLFRIPCQKVGRGRFPYFSSWAVKSRSASSSQASRIPVYASFLWTNSLIIPAKTISQRYTLGIRRAGSNMSLKTWTRSRRSVFSP